MVVVLCFPHLMLTDVGDDDGFALGFLPKVVDDMGCVKVPTIRQTLNVAHRRVAFQLGDMVNPCRMIAGFDVWCEPFEYCAGIADEGGVNLHVLVDFGAVDLDVDLSGALRVSAQVAGDAIVKTHADGNEEVGFLDGVVDPGFAVHTHHAEVEGVIGREAADAEERHGDRIIAGADELLKGTHRTRNHDAMAGENDGAFGGVQHLDSAVEFGLIVIVASAFGRKFWRRCFPVEFCGSLLRVFCDVDKDRAGTSAIGNQEGFAEGARNVLGFGDHHVVLGDGHGDSCDVDLLKRVGAQYLAANLAGYANDRRRVQHRRGDAGNHIGRAWTRCSHGHADPTTGTGVAIGHVCGTLFVPHEDVVQLRFTERVIDRKYGAAGIAEDLAHAETRERFAKNFRTAELHSVLAFKTG